MTLKILRPKGNSLLDYQPNKDKFYSTRASNNITEIKKWIKAVKLKKGVIVDKKNLFKDPYWAMRHKGGHEKRYDVYADYSNLI